MTFPNFVIVGAAKAGTSSVFAYLGQHPGVYISPAKEPNYFALAEQRVNFTGPGDAIINQASITRREAYEALFRSAKPGMAIGEASTLYLSTPGTAARIRRHAPGVRLIAILRDPAERAYSSYLHMRRDGREPCETFEAALDQEASRIRDGWEHLWHYTRLGFYHAQLQEYYAVFPREQIAVWLYEDLQADPARVLREVFSFLGVDPGFEPDMSVKHKVAGTPRSRALHAVLTRPNAVKSVAKALLPDRVRGRLYGALMQRNIVAQRDGLPPQLRQKLQSLFQSDVERLGPLIGRDVSGWLPNSTSVPR